MELCLRMGLQICGHAMELCHLTGLQNWGHAMELFHVVGLRSWRWGGLVMVLCLMTR